MPLSTLSNDRVPATSGNGPSLRDLQAIHTDVVSDGEFGVIAICVDADDPGFTQGAARILGGDDGLFIACCPPFPADRLDALALALARALVGTEAVCRRTGNRPGPNGSGGMLTLRSHCVQAAPDGVVDREALLAHRGRLCGADRFCLLAVPNGQDVDHVLAVLMMETQDGAWTEAYACDIAWLPMLADLARQAADRRYASVRP